MDERYQNNIYEISFYVTEEMHLNDWLFVTFSSKIFLDLLPYYLRSLSIR